MKDKPMFRIVPWLRDAHNTPDVDYWGYYLGPHSVPIVGFSPKHAWERFLVVCGPAKSQGTGDL